MNKSTSLKISYQNSLEWLTAIITGLLVLGVLQTFIIGRHYIIPTAILTFSILLGNLTFYAFKNKLWAKKVVFWLYTILLSHSFFALFWAKIYRDILGQAYIPTCIILILLLTFSLVNYKRSNKLFSPK